MKNCVGTMSIGVRSPIIQSGDNVPQIVASCVLNASKELGMPIEDGDVIAVTESVVARAEGNYVTVNDIANDVAEKFGNNKIGLIYPILSRNRFAVCLKGICRGAKGGVVLVLNLPADEVGNHLVTEEQCLSAGFDGRGYITEKEFTDLFGSTTHEFTGVDYIEYYKSIAKSENCNMDIIFTCDPTSVLLFTGNILCCDIHTRKQTKSMFRKFYAGYKVFGLDDICSTPTVTTGFNSKYGLLGSNKAGEERVKLFPQIPEYIVSTVQYLVYERTGKSVEVLVYGDGAFKDPVGKIWELADPVVGVAYSSGLRGRPNELKLKALADEKFANLKGKELRDAIKSEIRAKGKNLKGSMASQGTTPRQITDLLGSLADLTSGSGDKGTPIVWIKGYFKNYADS